jgi:tetratricopeptide (TPR) repeat protein
VEALTQQKDYNLARYHLEQDLEIKEKIHGSTSPELVLTYHQLVELLFHQKDYEAAYDVGLHTLTICTQVYELFHINIRRSLLNVGMSLMNLGLWEDAKLYLESTITIWKKIFGDNHRITDYSQCLLYQVHLQQTGIQRKMTHQCLNLLDINPLIPLHLICKIIE